MQKFTLTNSNLEVFILMERDEEFSQMISGMLKSLLRLMFGIEVSLHVHSETDSCNLLITSV